MLIQIFQDALFAAIAAIGFAAISHPPRKAYLYCAVIAAAGHSARFIFLSPAVGMHIVVATLIASIIIGLLAVFLSPVAKIPAETCFFPALLPMVPGIYAYRAFGGIAMCLLNGSESTFSQYFYLFASNSLTCLFILMAMVVGSTLPVFIFGKVSFTATR